MATFLSRKRSISFSMSLIVATIVAASAPTGFISDAQAQQASGRSAGNSASSRSFSPRFFGNRGFVSRNGATIGEVVPVFRDPALRRLGLGNRSRSAIVDSASGAATSTGRQRSGVRFDNRSFGNRDSRFFNPRDLLFVERQRDIAARNEAIRLQNRRRAGVGAGGIGGLGDSLILDVPREAIFTSDANSNGTGGTFSGRASSPCPRGHNCGYRVYQDGTGPRIITLGVEPGGDLPQFDGLNGPQVITLD